MDPIMATPSLSTASPVPSTTTPVRCTRARQYPRLATNQSKQFIPKRKNAEQTVPVVKNSFSLLDDFVCPNCNVEVKDNEEALECDTCFKWRHKRCTSVTDEVYAHIDTTGADWVCSECSPEISKVKDSVPCSSDKMVLNPGDNVASEIEISSCEKNPKDNDVTVPMAPTQIRECPGCQRHVTKGILCPGTCVTWPQSKKGAD